MRSEKCGCSRSVAELSRQENRPGMSSIDYRIGTHPLFFYEMLSLLHSWKVPEGENEGTHPLGSLTTRELDDPAIAILDAWAAVADVLTFYQERIANEGFLRTATERFSILEMARTIGYELKPGVAATAHLAFTVEDAPGSPGSAIVPAGTRVQSIPGQGELPQTFETSEEITAKAEWNILRPRMKRPQEIAIIPVDPSEDWIYHLDISTSFPDAEGQKKIASDQFDQIHLLDPSISLPVGRDLYGYPVTKIFLEGTDSGIEEGDRLLLVGYSKGGATGKKLFVLVRSVVIETDLKRTMVELAELPEAIPPSPYVPPFRTMILPFFDILPQRVAFSTVGVNSVLNAGAWREKDLAAFVSIQGWNKNDLVKSINTGKSTAISSPIFSQLAMAARREAGRGSIRGSKGNGSEPAGIDDSGVFAFDEKLAVFGNNAPYFGSLPEEMTKGIFENWDDKNNGWDIWHDSRIGFDFYDADIYLERTLSGVVPGSWAVIETSILPPGVKVKHLMLKVKSAVDASPVGFATSIRATGLNFEETINKNGNAQFKIRNTSVYVKSRRLDLASLPIDDPIAKGKTDIQLDSMVMGLFPGQPVILTGERDDPPGVSAAEILFLKDIVHADGFTTIYFTTDIKSSESQGLKYSYLRKTVAINANVSQATHGETRSEVLGSGDGSLPNQRFRLKKPLTYVSAPTPSGIESTLSLRANDVLWAEVPRLYGLDQRSESYIVRIDNDANASVIFGDGIMGARLPTGLANITAVYRSGIGAQGMVPADKITLIQNRPLGIRSVTNPLPADGAEDPENRDMARVNAPMTVLTMDRIVSLRDYEYFARSFAGIGKARAVSLASGEVQFVHVTVASAISTSSDEPDSALASHVIDSNSDIYRNLYDAIAASSDPVQRFSLGSYDPIFFNVSIKLIVDPRYRPDDVASKVEEALRSAFSFEMRDFGQDVTSSEIIEIIQGVAGVVACEISALDKYVMGEPGSDQTSLSNWGEVIEAKEEELTGTAVLPAELLLINPVGIQIEAVIA